MLKATIKVKTTGLQMDKQTIFALAAALTATAKLGQTAVLKAMDAAQGGAFTIRTGWTTRGPYAVKIRPATKTNLNAWVGTAADWLEKFIREPAGSTVLKLPQGEFIAIPTSNVRRTKRDLIRAAQRPRALKGKRDYLIPLRHGRGWVLMQKQGRGKQARGVPLYVLVPKAKIKERDVLFGPTRRAFEKNFSKLFNAQLERAFATARR